MKVRSTGCVAITGSAGRVGRLTVSALKSIEGIRLRLIDRVPEHSAPGGAEVRTGNLHDEVFRDRAFTDIGTVIHLAANPYPGSSTDRVMQDFAMTINAFDSARRAKVRRFIFASSVHAMGLYNRPDRWPVRNDWAPAPCCPYGVGKAASEAYLRYQADATGTEVLALRLGMTGWGRGSLGDSALWLSNGDFSTLIRRAVTVEFDGFQTSFGISANAPMRWDIATPTPIGFVPRDDSAQHAPDRDEDPSPYGCLLKSLQTASFHGR